MSKNKKENKNCCSEKEVCCGGSCCCEEESSCCNSGCCCEDDSCCNESCCDKEDECCSSTNSKSEIVNLKKENEQLLKKIENLKNEVTSYQFQLNKINDEYIQKVNEKSKEAKELLNKKILELEEKSKEEINSKINKYIEDKFSSMLDTIDRLNLIINSSNSSPEVNNYLQGFKMFSTMFQNSLNELNIQQIEVKVGDKFNEEYMQAFELVDDKKVSSGCVSSIVSQAYKYNNKVIKHAIVRVQK